MTQAWNQPAPQEGALLSPDVFTSPAIFEAEMRDVFPHAWVHVADLVDVKKPGDYVAANVGRVPVIVLRDEDGGLRGFVNACRHRGATLVEGTGNCGKQLQCPYHAWSYRTSGELVGVPYPDEFCDDVKKLSLHPVRVDSVGPFVFACLDEDAPSLREWVGDIAPALERARGEEMELAFEVEYEVACNWKVYVENALDGYHIGFVHDVLADFVQDRRGASHDFGEHWSYTLAKLSDEFRALLPPVPHLDEVENTHIRFGLIFPNIIPVITPGDVNYLRIDPIDVGRIRLRSRSFDLGGPARDMVPLRREATDVTNKQDIAIVERVQRGLAGGLAPGVYARHLEARIGHFERMWHREMSARSNPLRVMTPTELACAE